MSTWWIVNLQVHRTLDLHECGLILNHNFILETWNLLLWFEYNIKHQPYRWHCCLSTYFKRLDKSILYFENMSYSVPFNAVLPLWSNCSYTWFPVIKQNHLSNIWPFQLKLAPSLCPEEAPHYPELLRQWP